MTQLTSNGRPRIRSWHTGSGWRDNRLDPAIKSWYFPRQNPRALWRQYFNYGMCKASTLKKHRTLPYWRPLAPAALVVGLAGSLALSLTTRRLRWFGVTACSYATSASANAVRLGTDPGVAPHRAASAIVILSFRLRTRLRKGIGRILVGRPFDSRPRGAR